MYVKYYTGFNKIPPKQNGTFTKLSSVGEKEKNITKYSMEDKQNE